MFAAPASMESSSTPSSDIAPAPDASRALSILAVDDEEGIRLLLRQWLSRAGHRVELAANGAEAMRLLHSVHFDLVITDVVMPDGDGLELIAEFKKSQAAARILAISGGGRYLQGSDCLKIARGLGAHAVVMKPFNRQQLVAGIEQAMRAAP